MWYKSKVIKGDQLGKKIGFPTVNLDPFVLDNSFKEGVYACSVEYEKKRYQGALYFGPRLVLGESNKVLEINILDFDKDIYDHTVNFKVGKYIRKPLNFSNSDELIMQLKKDVLAVRSSGKIFCN